MWTGLDISSHSLVPAALLVIDFVSPETYFRPLEKLKSGRNGATEFVICHLSIVIGHLTALNLAGFNDKWQMTNEK